MKKKKKFNIFVLLCLLVIVAILLNWIVFFIFNRFISDIRSQTNEMISVERGLNSFIKEFEDYYEKQKNYLDTYLDLRFSYVNMENVSHKEFRDFGSFKNISKVDDLKPLFDILSSEMKKIHVLESEILKWRKESYLTFEDIKEGRSLSEIRNTIMGLKNSINFLDEQSFDLSDQDVNHLSKNKNSDYLLFRYQIDELSLCIEKLHVEMDIDNLVKFGNNGIKNSLAKINNSISLLIDGDIKSRNSSIDSLNQLTGLIFGKGYFLDQAQHSKVKEEGYFQLKQKYLQAVSLQNNLLDALEESHINISLLIKDLKDSTWTRLKEALSRQRLLFSKTWERLIRILVIAIGVFIFISLAIALFIKNQIEKERKIKNEITSIINGAGDAMLVLDRDYSVIRVNDKMAEITGISHEDSIGKKYYELFSGSSIHEHRRILKSVLEKGKNIQFELLEKDKDGLEIPFDVMVVPLKENGRIISILESYRDISEYKKMQKKIEKNNRSLLQSEIALKNILWDLRASHIELRDTQKQLIKSEKMASVGQLSAGVAHEINNPTGFVLSNLEVLTGNITTLFETIENTDYLIKKYLPKEKDANLKFHEEFEEKIQTEEVEFLKDDLPSLVAESIEGVRRIKKIVGNLKNFAHPGKEEQKPTDVNEELEKALNLIHNEIKYNCEVIKDFQEVPTFKANSQQLEQVFINIIINAAQSIEKKGIITIKTYLKNSVVIVEIADNGSGISKADVGQIFNPFFTTKDVGKGTGLGLSIVYRIIEDHGGKIEVESQIGKGTKFIISLPTNNK